MFYSFNCRFDYEIIGNIRKKIPETNTWNYILDNPIQILHIIIIPIIKLPLKLYFSFEYLKKNQVSFLWYNYKAQIGYCENSVTV